MNDKDIKKLLRANVIIKEVYINIPERNRCNRDTWNDVELLHIIAEINEVIKDNAV